MTVLLSAFQRIFGTGFDECKYSQRGKEGIGMHHFDIPIIALDFQN